MKTEDFVIFDAGKGLLERFTIFPYLKDSKVGGYKRGDFLGTCDSGMSFSLWGNMSTFSNNYYYRPLVSELRHLGKRVKFECLPCDLQKHIIARVR